MCVCVYMLVCVTMCESVNVTVNLRGEKIGSERYVRKGFDGRDRKAQS